MAARVTRPHRSLPDEIVIWEILVRLPPLSLLRCRIICRLWRRATSTPNFLLAHHARQPTLPLMCANRRSGVDIVPYNHEWAADDRLQPVAQLNRLVFNLEASCDGLLIISDRYNRFSICNPTTREYAHLRKLDDLTKPRKFTLLGMYPHIPTGEYRLLGKLRFERDDQDASCDVVFTIGSSQPPREIGCPHAWERIHAVPVLFHGSLHWYTGGQTIMVFDTIVESFRKMRPPIIVSGDAGLFESGGMLGISIFNDKVTVVNIWMMQDYESEVWAFKHRVELPIAEIWSFKSKVDAHFGDFQGQWSVVVPSCDSDVFGLVRFGDWLLQIDMDGKLVASFHREGLRLTSLWLKQTLFPHTFFRTLEGYVVNQSPFI